MSAYFVRTYYKIFTEYCDEKDFMRSEDSANFALAVKILAGVSLALLYIIIFIYFKCDEMK